MAERRRAAGEYGRGSFDVPAEARTRRLVLGVSPTDLCAGERGMKLAGSVGTSYVVPLAN